MTRSYLYPGKGYVNDVVNTSNLIPYYGYLNGTGGVLTSGLADCTSFGNTIATVIINSAIGGAPPYSYQWYRSQTPNFTPGAGNIVSGATSQTLNDTGLTNGNTYYYTCITTDNASNTVQSNYVVATPQLPISNVFIGDFFGM